MQLLLSFISILCCVHNKGRRFKILFYFTQLTRTTNTIIVYTPYSLLLSLLMFYYTLPILNNLFVN